MSLICITGHQGTGKSTLLYELRSKGYAAYGIDEEKIAGYFNTALNAPSETIPDGIERNQEWRKHNVWRADLTKLQQLEIDSNNAPVFIFGYAVNIEEVWDLADVVIVLTLDDKTTEQRLLNRTNNSFGKHPGEIELALQNSQTIQQKAQNYTHHPVHYLDASLPVEELAKAILIIAKETA